MLLSLLRSSDPGQAIVLILLMIPVILFSLSAHEFAHGYAAYKCGDSTAKNFGRLTLFPLKHLDPIGALMMLLVGFGWAKPVPVNVRNFKKPKRDMVIVSLAGPLSNIVIAFIAALLMAAFIKFAPYPTGETAQKFYTVFWEILFMFHFLNLGLAVFNLIPIPPLDGSKILAGILPNDLAYRYLSLERYLRFFFLILIISTWIPVRIGSFNDLGDLLFYPVTALRNLMSDGMTWLAYKIFFIS